MAEAGLDLKQTKILLVDDLPSNLQTLSDVLNAYGYTNVQARDGQTALNLVQTDPPDLILLDIYMPGMDGYEVCRRLKADERTKHIPVVFISALSDIESVVKGFEAGGADYIVKPFQFREVLARVVSQLTLVQQRRQIEALRAQDRQHFESLHRMKDQFIRMATHDLRNPLNVILGYATMIERLNTSDRDLPLRDQAVENIRESVEKMRSLVSDLLDFAQFETGTYLTLVPVPLSHLLDKCLNSLHVVAIQKNIELVYTAPPEEVMINMDESYMARVIDNLGSNAIKYTPSGGRVEVRIELKDQQAYIQVTDTGLGIPEEDLPHIFDPFYRVRQAGHAQVEGSGLGLSIVKTVVEQHHGQVTVESAPGKGSTFRVTLPVVQSIPQGTAPQSAILDPAAPA